MINAAREQRLPEKLTSLGPSKNIVEVMSLVKDAIEDYEKRTSVPDKSKVTVVYDEPHIAIELETISLKIQQREPGMFGQDKPFQNSAGAVKNIVPILREEGDDPDNPGYKRAIFGYWHDNILRITCWSMTNKEANARMLWLEEVMEQYRYYFIVHGTNRFFYWRHPDQIAKIISNNILYGRPIDFYVKTETIRAVSEKELEQIYIKVAARRDGNLNFV